MAGKTPLENRREGQGEGCPSSGAPYTRRMGRVRCVLLSGGLPGGGKSGQLRLAFLPRRLSGLCGFTDHGVVYLQDTRLKELTLEEYAAAFSIRIKALEMAADTEEDRKQIFSYLKQGQEKYVSYFKHDAFPLGKERQEAKENCVPKIFFSLKNAGKLPVKKLRFKEIRIEPYEAVQEKGSADPIAESCGYRFAEKGGANILNGRHELLPEGALNICLVIHSIPEKLPFSAFRLTFRFELGAKVMEQTVLFYIEVKGKDKITISDGEVVF